MMLIFQTLMMNERFCETNTMAVGGHLWSWRLTPAMLPRDDVDLSPLQRLAAAKLLWLFPLDHFNRGILSTVEYCRIL